MEQDDIEPAIDFDGDGNMTAWRLGDYEILIERNPDGTVRFWTDSHGNFGTGGLPVPDETLIVIDCPPLKPPTWSIRNGELELTGMIVMTPPRATSIGIVSIESILKGLPVSDSSIPIYDAKQLISNQPPSVQWCLDPRLMPQGDVPEAECPDCCKPISRCGCA